MTFSSLEFIFLFLPIFFAVYYLIPQRYRNYVIFIGSLIFTAVATYKQPEFLIILAVSAIVNYFLGIAIDFFPRRGSISLAVGIVFNIGTLFFFKYSKYIIGSMAAVFSLISPISSDFSPSSLILPLGLSFYSFRAVSYLADIRKGKCPAERSPIDFFAFFCMFPCLVAGPLAKYRDVRQQLKKRSYSIDVFVSGIRLFIAGLGLKIILASHLSAMWQRVGALGFESISSPLAWLAIIAYSLFIYFDFYGYSLMAVGLGKMLGFVLPDNFKDPYLSLGMADFWRRWHITLGDWFKEYIYIPLGGSRRGIVRTIINLFAVWIFTGIWHGATPNFILWGIVLFLIIVAEKYGFGEILEKIPTLGHIYMALLIPLTWAIFAIPDLARLGTFFCRLFPFIPQGEVYSLNGDWIKYGTQYGLYILCGLIFISPLPEKLTKKLNKTLIGDIILIAVFGLSVYFMCSGVSDPFLYQSF